ncbi:MAG: prolyl oligopeptidase family serine peptidase [Dokdonella sp.]
MRAGLIALAIIALFAVSQAKAGMYPVVPGENPQLKANEALLVVAIDTGMPLEAAFMSEEGAVLNSRVLKHIAAGRTFQLLRVPAGRYGWHSLRIGDWAHSSFWYTYQLSNKKEGYFDVRPGVINYGGDLVVRPRDVRHATIYMSNRGLPAIDWLEAQHPQLASQREFVYSGHYQDPFPAFYQKERASQGKRKSAYGEFSAPPDAGELKLAPKVLWQKDRVYSVKLNEAGNLLAMQVREDGKQRWAVDLIDLESSESHRVALTDIAFETMQWSGDDTLLLSLPASELGRGGINQRDSDNFVSVVHAARNNAGKRKYEAWSVPHRGRVLDVLPDDPDHVLFATIGVSGALHVNRLDVSSQKALAEFKPEGEISLNHDGNGEYWWFADGAGQLSVAFSIDEGNVVLSRPNGKRLDEFFRIKSESGFVADSVSPDGRSIYATSDDDREQRDLVELDIATGKITKTLFSKPGVDVYSTIFDRQRHPIGVRYYEAGRLVSDYFETQDRHLADLLKKSFPGRSVSVIEKSADAKQLVLWVESSDSTPKIYHLDINRARAELIEDTMPWLAKSPLSPSEVVTAKSKDGLPIEAYLTLPPAGGKRPLIVMPHGGPIGVSDTLRFDRDTQFLASLGYAVLRVNYRGSDGFGKSFRKAGKGKFGTAIEDDIDAALSVALANYPLDSTRMCVLGLSYGGYSALISAARWPERFRCAVSVAGITDRMLFYTASDGSRTAQGRANLERILGDPKVERDEMIVTSPLYRFREIKVPVMLAHGLDDQRVDYEHSRRMQRMLDLAGRPPVGLTFPGEGHGFEDLDNLEKLWTGIAGFLKQNLGPEIQSKAASEAPEH